MSKKHALLTRFMIIFLSAVTIVAILPPQQAWAADDVWVTIHIREIWLDNPDTGDGEPEFKLYIATKYPQDKEYFAVLTHPANGDTMRPPSVNTDEYLLTDDNPMQLPPSGLTIIVPDGVSGAVIEIKVVDDDAIRFDQIVEENQILSESIEPFVLDMLQNIGSENSDVAFKGALEWLTGEGFDYFAKNKGRLATLFGRAVTGVGSIAYDLIAAEDELGTVYIELDRTNSSGFFSAESEDGNVKVEYELRLAFGDAQVFDPTPEPPIDPIPEPIEEDEVAAHNRFIWFKNDCHHPLQLALHYLDADNGWTTNGWWHFDPMTADYLIDGRQIQSDSDLFYFYAEATDESGDRWIGDLTVEFAGLQHKNKQIARRNVSLVNHQMVCYFP